MKLCFHNKIDKSKLPYKKDNNGKIIDIKKNEKQIALSKNIIRLILIITLLVPFFKVSKEIITHKLLDFFIACFIGYFSIYIHELLHAICYKKEVFIFIDFFKGKAFTIGVEDMSKAKYIFTSLLPNVLLGIIPYVIFLVNDEAIFFGVYGALCLIMGYQDFFNIYNVIKYTPHKSKIYLSGENAYWHK